MTSYWCAAHCDSVVSWADGFQMGNTWKNRRCRHHISISAMDFRIFGSTVAWLTSPWYLCKYAMNICFNQYSNTSPNTAKTNASRTNTSQYLNLTKTINTNATNTSVPSIAILLIHQYSSKPSIPIPKSLGVATCLIPHTLSKIFPRVSYKRKQANIRNTKCWQFA
jgi:hypothetical protein